MEEQIVIQWRSKALLQVESTVRFLTERGAIEASDAFLDDVKSAAARVAQSPNIGRLEKKDGEVRSWPIDRHRRLIYSVKANVLVVLQVWDMRQDPGKLKF